MHARPLAALVAAAAVVAGCGTSDEDKVKSVLQDYNAALVDGNGKKACGLFTSEGQKRLAASLKAIAPSSKSSSCPQLVRDVSATITDENGKRIKDIKITRIKVDGAKASAMSGVQTQLAKDGGDWKITKPVQTRADFGSVEGLVGRLGSVQMKSIVTETPSPADLKKYGLATPEATVNLNAGSARATLLMGGKAENNTVYARDASKPAVITVESALLDDLKKGADDYRRKDIFEFRPFNANRIEMARNGQTLVLERVKGKGENAPDTWHRVSPTAADVDKEKSDGLLSKLSNIRAASFVDAAAKTGLDKPALTVTVKFDDGKREEKVTFGQNGSDVYVARPGEPGAAKIDAADFNDAMKSLDELSK